MEKKLRQHRTKTIYWILCMSCLHLFRHIAQFVLARRQPCYVLVVQSDEKSDCAIHAQSLCGIALKFAAALLALILLSGCAADNKPEQSEPQTSASSAGVSVVSRETEPEVTVQETSGAVGTSDTSEAASKEVSSAEAGSFESGSGQAPAEIEHGTVQVSDEPAETVSDVSSVTAVTTSQTPAQTAPSVAVTTTAAATEPPKPVKVVIPEVRVPLSPGKDTASNEKVLVDYSNRSEGYISVCWKESGKRVKLRMVCGDKTYDHDVAGGGAVEYFPISCGSGTYKVQIYEQTEGDKYAKSLETEFSVKLRSETSPFLYPNKYVNFSQSSSAVKKAAEVCAGKSDEIEKLAAIFVWVTDNVTYDTQLAATVKSGYVPNPDSVLAKRSGICYDYASLMAAMVRSQGIPARLVVGYAADNIYHAWNEVWTDETGWITPELLLSKKGYNIVDATFYAGSSNKEKIADYIQNSGNYAALYYY